MAREAQLPWALGTAYSAAKASAEACVREPTATSSASGRSARSAAKERAMPPVARMPHLMRSDMRASLVGQYGSALVWTGHTECHSQYKRAPFSMKRCPFAGG